MSRFNKSLVVLALLCCANASASSFEDEKAKLEAQLELVQKQKALQDALRALVGSSAGQLPTVVSVMQAGEEAIVRLQLANGQVNHYRKGDMVQRGMVLSSVAPREVIVSLAASGRRQTPVVLEFASPPGLMPQPVPDREIPPALLPEPPRIAVTVPAIEVIPAAPPSKPVGGAAAAQVKAGK